MRQEETDEIKSGGGKNNHVETWIHDNFKLPVLYELSKKFENSVMTKL